MYMYTNRKTHQISQPAFTEKKLFISLRAIAGQDALRLIGSCWGTSKQFHLGNNLGYSSVDFSDSSGEPVVSGWSVESFDASADPASAS